MDHESMPGKGPVERRVRPGAEARHLPTPADLRSYADDADQHGNHWVPIAPASLRGVADEIERLSAERNRLRAACVLALSRSPEIRTASGRALRMALGMTKDEHLTTDQLAAAGKTAKAAAMWRPFGA